MKVRRIVTSLLLGCLMVTIFFFSSQNGKLSTKTSDRFTGSIIDTYQGLTKIEVSKKRKNELIKEMRYVVRKSAHFIIYLNLGLVCALMLRSYGVKRWFVYSLLFCFLFACSDEVHQLFLGGRSSSIKDVVIDTMGSLMGILGILGIVKIRKRA